MDRATWALQHRNVRLKPPPWWLAQQDAEGREKAKFAIWWKRYDQSRRLAIWMLAPSEDFRTAGYGLVEE